MYDGPESLARARRGLLEPTGPRLGLEAVATADVVLTPGLAVDRTGMRLGQGGGCYDRALGRVPVGTFMCTLLYDGELLDEVPTDAHDRPVTAVVTPSGLTRLSGPARSADPAQSSARDQREGVLRGGLHLAREDGHGRVRPSAHRSVWST